MNPFHHHNAPPPPPPPHHQAPPPPVVHHAPAHHQPPPPLVVHHAPTHHQPQPAVVVHHVSHLTTKHTPKYTDNKPTFRFYTKVKTNFSLTIRGGTVVLAPTNPSDHHQHWIKEEKFSARLKDEQGFPSFALVNKATGQALRHSANELVQLMVYNQDRLDESVLWTQSNDLGDGFHAVRAVDNIKLHLDASKSGSGIQYGSKVLLSKWTKGDTQRWTFAHICKFLNSNCCR